MIARPVLWAMLGMAILAGPLRADTPAVPQPVPADLVWPTGFRAAVAKCWNLDSLSKAARQGEVTLRVEFDRQGLPDADLMQIVGPSDTPDAARDELFASARRALMRCAGDGYDLPADRYALWKVMELTFSPSQWGQK